MMNLGGIQEEMCEFVITEQNVWESRKMRDSQQVWIQILVDQSIGNVFSEHDPLSANPMKCDCSSQGIV